MRIAVEGCCHGELDAIYGAVAEADARSGQRTDVLLICGDFQAVRNDADMPCMAMPQKYWQLGTFSSYYSGQTVAPYLTIVIGGNHETSNYMWELYHGGWLAPRIYYLGAAGSVLVNGLRIAGASGIYKSHDYRRGHYERLPFDHSSLRSIYHIREYDVFRLAQLALDGRSPGVFLSHDWPLAIERYGDTPALLRAKPFFTAEVARNELGSPPLAHLLTTLKPAYWFAAHLHVRFAALCKHDPPEPTRVKGQVLQADRAVAAASGNANAQPLGVRGPAVNADEITLEVEDDKPAANGAAVVNADEIELQLSDSGDDAVEAQARAVAVDAARQPDAAIDESVDLDEARAAPVNPDEIAIEDDEPVVVVAAPAPAPPPTARATKFLALDKCLPGRHFLQIIDVDTPTPLADGAEPTLTFDPLWLAITRAFHSSLPLTRDAARNMPFDDPSRAHALVTRELEWVRANVPERGLAAVADVQLFEPTAPAQQPGQPARKLSPNDQPPAYTNPQTEAFCAMLQIENKINPRKA